MRRIVKLFALAVWAVPMWTGGVHAQQATGEPGPDQDGTLAALTRIAGEGMMSSRAFEYLTEMSDDIGARVTGSPAMWKAVEWSEADKEENRSGDHVVLVYFTVCSTPTFFNTSGGGPSKLTVGMLPT